MSETILTSRGSVAGRHFWVVGGADGLGAALAHELRARGAGVAVSSLHRDTNAVAADDHPLRIPVDVADEADVVRAAGSVRDALGGLDGLVVAAGGDGPFRRREDDPAPAEVVDVLGLGNLLAAVLPALVQQRDGHVVGVAAGRRRTREESAYRALVAQLAVLAAMRSSLGAKDVRVTTAVARSSGAGSRGHFALGERRTSRRIVDAVEDGAAEVVFTRATSRVRSALREVPRRPMTPAHEHAGRASR